MLDKLEIYFIISYKFNKSLGNYRHILMTMIAKINVSIFKDYTTFNYINNYINSVTIACQ